MKKRTQLFYAIFETKNSFIIGVGDNKNHVAHNDASNRLYNFKNSIEFLFSFGKNKKLKLIYLSIDLRARSGRPPPMFWPI